MDLDQTALEESGQDLYCLSIFFVTILSVGWRIC